MPRFFAAAVRTSWRAVTAVLLVATLLPALAAESNLQQSPRTTVSLVSDHAAVSPGQTLRIGLRQRLAPHWHTYWKNPGDAGSPPNIAFTLPQGATVGAIDWPGPDRFIIGPVASYGYENEIVFPMRLTVPQDARPGSQLVIESSGDWVVCEKECIPEEGKFRLSLPVEASPRPAAAEIRAAFSIADARRPQAAPWKASLAAGGSGLQLLVKGEGITSQSVRSALFFPERWGLIDHVAPQSLEVGQGELSMKLQKAQGYAPGPAKGLLAITDGGGRKRWFALELAPATASAGELAAADAKPASLPLWQMAVFAFIGGLILNLMPCVFPVLAIKATAFAGMSGSDRREVRLSAVFYTLGVLAAFMALAIGLLAVRAGGGAVGWGFQFQSPLFVASMCWLMLAIGLNLSGVFEVGSSLAGTGQQLAERKGHAGSFFTGLLAVVVATPCTAPFMGAAIGSALVAPAYVSLVVFAMMGLGLALPFLLLGLFPAVARRLPRPGMWMVTLRQAMAFPMYATAAWLLWVLAQQAGEAGLRTALAGAVLVGLVGWLVGLGQQGVKKPWWPRGFAVLGMAGLFGLMAVLHTTEPVAPSSQQATNAEPYSAERLASLRAAGKPVFVNMTAAWCITCLVNERTTLSTAAVQQAMQAQEVVYMKGDWTNRDPAITAFLQSFQRDGLPFYAFYPPGKEAVVLPPVLTQAIVTEAIEQ
ncbi:cytochrome C biogenesis protein [Massilia sp. ML15P13]|uniref:Cytochrome C biogenesis protein n=1 Tax=Telluria aromaticivorans TaxID=2725995 RepID=A0A7Y2K5G1_9BURK|nr:thioredoxin family protein [Telluria aromaticivorans]NNG25804.1 cytochrome C biogenesis protein [Telluria aromaticivorans]